MKRKIFKKNNLKEERFTLTLFQGFLSWLTGSIVPGLRQSIVVEGGAAVGTAPPALLERGEEGPQRPCPLVRLYLLPGVPQAGSQDFHLMGLWGSLEI